MVFPSKRRTITAIHTDSKFKGAHNYRVQPMLHYADGAVYARDKDDAMELNFVKRREDGTWQKGLQTEQLLEVLIDRHHKLQDVFPTEQTEHNSFIAHLTAALAILEKRVTERTARGVMGQSVK